MRPIFLGLLGAVAAKYLRVFEDYNYINAYLDPVDGSFTVKDDKSDAGSEFDYDGGKLVVPSGSLGYREDGRVIVGGSEIPVNAFYIGEGETAGILPAHAPYNFYICYSGEAPDTLYLYYINPDVYWNNTTDDGGPSTGDDGGPSTGDDGGPSTGDDGGPSTGDDGGPSTGDDGGPSTGDDGGPSTGDDGPGTGGPGTDDGGPSTGDGPGTDDGGPSTGDGPGPDDGGPSTGDGPGIDDGGPTTDDGGIDTGGPSDPVETPPVETVPIEGGGEAPTDATGAGNPQITEPPSDQSRRVRRVRRVKLARRESVAPEPAQPSPEEGMCYVVNLELVPTTSDPCSNSDDPTCLSSSCTTLCVVATCIPEATLCPLPVCYTHCPPDTCTTICSDVSCASGTSCTPSCTTECESSDSCETIYATQVLTGSPVPKWTVSCPNDVCVDVCTGCTSKGCTPLCTTSCPSDTGGPSISKPTNPPKDGGGDSCRGTTCKCTTCPTVTVIPGCPTCVHTVTNWVFTCPLATTITISTCTQNKCSPTTLTFLPGTHTVPGTAVVPVKSNILLTIKPGGTGGTGATGGTGGTGTTKASGTGSAGTTAKPSGSGSGSTTAGNDASRNSLLGTFVGAVLFGLLMW